MAAACEAAAGEGKGPVYIIGTEVPVPGGETDGFAGIRVTNPIDVADTIETHRRAFAARGLEAAFERVIGVVVQPGVDFDHSGTIPYDPAKARALVEFIETQPGMVYEAHSTDYQTPEALRALVRDHFAILKVGPALTFALREGLFALAAMEDELLPVEQRSHLRAVLERAMLDAPGSWAPYYRGDATELHFLRSFSKSDRIRYYWTRPEVEAAVARLRANLGEAALNDALLRQFAGLERKRGALTPDALVTDKIFQVLEDYAFGANP